MENSHDQYILQCIELGKIALSNGNPPVGAILVHNNLIVGKGIESGKSTGDITNHAEILAVRDAIKNGNTGLLNLSTLYSTHEPCIMCSYLIRHHKIPEIIFGVAVDYVGGITSYFNILKTDKVPKWGQSPIVSGGICEQECIALNDEFKIYLIKN